MSDKKVSSSRLFGWLWRNYLRVQYRPLTIAIFCMVVEGSMLGVLSAAMLPMFDTVFIEGDRSALWPVGLTILVIFLVRAASSVGQKVMMTAASERAMGDMRNNLARHLMDLDSSYHQSNPPGNLIERVQGDVTAIGGLWQGIVSGIVRDGIAVVWLFGVALWVDWKWTLAALVGIPILVLPSLLAQSYVRRKSKEARQVAADMSTRLDEVFHGINPIKLNSLEDYQHARYGGLVGKRV